MSDEHEREQPEQEQEQETTIDEGKYLEKISAMEGEQSFVGAVLAGAAAALVSAAIWGFVTVLTGYQIGWMAIGVGYLVGHAVRPFGKGVNKIFGLIGAAWAVFGCLFGNLVAMCSFVAQSQGVGTLDVLMQLDLTTSYQILAETFSPIDLLFYGIAIYEGYRFSFRQWTPEELAEMTQPAGDTRA